MINSRNLADLDPAARTVCNQMLALCHQSGIELLVTSTWRDFEAQDRLYAIGRTVELTRKPVTNAKAGKSWHNYKCAWDVAPLLNGKPIWNASDPTWQEVIAFGEAAGAEAGAKWKSFPDLPHFQLRPRQNDSLITLAEARIRFDATGTIFA